MQALRLKPLRINNIITTPLIKPEALPNKERPRLYISAFPQPEKSLPKMPSGPTHYSMVSIWQGKNCPILLSFFLPSCCP